MRRKLTGTFTGLKAVLGGGSPTGGNAARPRKRRSIKEGFSQTFSNVKGMMRENERPSAQEEANNDLERRLSSINVLLLITAIIETLIAVGLILLIAHLV